MKKRYIILFFAIICLSICIFQGVRTIKWKHYYNEVWVPIIEASKKSGASVSYENSYKLYKDNNNYMFCVFTPKSGKYDSNLQANEERIYDEAAKERQVKISLIIWPLKDRSICWGLMIDEMPSLNHYVGISTVYFDPNKMIITSENATETDYELFKQYKDRIQILVNYAFDIWGDTIK